MDDSSEALLQAIMLRAIFRSLKTAWFSPRQSEAVHARKLDPVPAAPLIGHVHDAYSIRDSLHGALHDFVRNSGFENVHLEEMIRELVGMLASYREEDLPLYPEVFVFSSPNGLKALAPSSIQVTLGSTQLVANSASAVLKNSAPLAASGWAIFVVKEGDLIRYGVFRSIRHTLALGAEESMLGLGREEPVMLIRNRGHLTVELRNTIATRFTATLTTTPAATSALESHVDRFVAAATAALADVNDFRGYLKRLLTDALQRCHGTLLVVVATLEGVDLDPTLQDAIRLAPRIRLAELQEAALKSGTADSLADLIAAEALLRGMINSDGVVVFGNDGSIVAFRVFLKPNDLEAAKLPNSGGGRRRTFELMRLRLGATFKAVFFRSQDGETRCERSDE